MGVFITLHNVCPYVCMRACMYVFTFNWFQVLRQSCIVGFGDGCGGVWGVELGRPSSQYSQIQNSFSRSLFQPADFPKMIWINVPCSVAEARPKWPGYLAPRPVNPELTIAAPNFRHCRGMATSIRTPALGHSQNTEFRLCRARGCVRLQHPWTSPSRSSSSSGLWALTGWEAPQVTPGILFEVVSLQCGYRPSLPHAIPVVHFNAILKAQGHWSAAWTIGPSWAARRHVFSLFLWKASPFCYRHYLISLWPL